MSSSQTIRILGIDPGFGRTGFGIIEKQGSSWKLISYGCIETDKKKDFVERLEELHIVLTHVIKKYQPTHSAVEDLYFAKNVTTAIKVAQARGVTLLTLRQARLPVYEFTPLQVKQSITGYGRAEKGQLQRMVKMILNVAKPITPDDAADALAVALTCGSSMKMLSRG